MDQRLERIERLLVGFDMRLEAIDSRLKNMPSMDAKAASSSPQPAKPLHHRKSSPQDLREHKTLQRAMYPILDGLGLPQGRGANQVPASASPKDGEQLETPAWLQSMLREMNAPESQSVPGQAAASPPAASSAAQTAPPKPQPPRSITLADGGAGGAASAAATRSATAAASTAAAAAAARAKPLFSHAPGAVSSEAASRNAPKAAQAQQASTATGSATGSVTAAAAAAAAAAAKPARRKRAPSSASDDWDAEWDEEDKVEIERASKPQSETSSLLEQIQALLKEQSAPSAGKGKRSKGKGKGKRGKSAELGEETREDEASASTGETAEAEAPPTMMAPASVPAAWPRSSGGGDDDEMSIEDVD